MKIQNWGLELGVRAIIGHEKSGDGNEIAQIQDATDIDIELFYQAVAADERGDYKSRDQILWKIMAFPPEVRIGSVTTRGGNSLQDFRLSVKGFRFALWMEQYGDLPPIIAARWLRHNLGPREPGN